MPYSYKIDTHHNIVLFKATGAFTSEILLECLNVVTADPKFKTNFNHLVDLQDLSSFPADSSDMQKRTSLDREMEEMIGEGKIALVSSNELVYGMTRMYEIMMDDALPTVCTFKQMDDAIDWLDIPKEIV